MNKFTRTIKIVSLKTLITVLEIGIFILLVPVSLLSELVGKLSRVLHRVNSRVAKLKEKPKGFMYYEKSPILIFDKRNISSGVRDSGMLHQRSFQDDDDDEPRFG